MLLLPHVDGLSIMKDLLQLNARLRDEVLILNRVESRQCELCVTSPSNAHCESIQAEEAAAAVEAAEAAVRGNVKPYASFQF